MQTLSIQTITPSESVLAMPCQADSDEHLVNLWLHGRGRHTRRAYAAELHRFQEFIRKPLQMVRLDDLQRFIDSLEGLADASRARATASIKSLFGFAHRIGYLRFDVGAAIATPKTRNRLSERILTEGQVIAMITLEPNKRNQALLRTLYIGGLRVSELAGLCWRDLIARGESEGQMTVFGKGSKTRVVLLPATGDSLAAARVNQKRRRRPGAASLSIAEGWPPGSIARNADRTSGRTTRRHPSQRLASLAEARSRITRSRPRLSGSSASTDIGA